MRLDPAAELAGFRLAAHETLDSTNAQALRLAFDRSASTEPLWITARQQTAGRGRRGNVWVSPEGNLYATLLLADPAAPRHCPQLSFVAALAVHDALVQCAPALRGRLALKWPNDLLCADAKVAGILLESHHLAGKPLADRLLADRLAVAIGIGINCRHHPEQTAYPATDLAAAGVEVSPDDAFSALCGTMMRRLMQWRRGEGFSTIRSDWLDRATGIGRDMLVRLPDRELHGRWETLDEHGQLLLRLADGSLETIAAGDVFPLDGPAPAAPALPQEATQDNAAE
ncbi:MAG TPA: biotin--[acetyl-CoA-carboxylase] ligase [Xanthobacteraceae bacterium]|nr:biotin--[acetyl-CoA-carboxylase] ligase [Xanthobacteraceae bacterium]